MNIKNLTDDQLKVAVAVIKEAKLQGINPNLALAVAFNESRFDPKAISPAGAIGVMQLMPDTAKDLNVDPRDLEQNISGGIQYLKNLGAQFDNDPAKTLAAYNAGPNSKFFRTGDVKDLPDETLQYVKRIATTTGGSLPSLTIETKTEVEEKPEPQAAPQPPQPPQPAAPAQPTLFSQTVDAAKDKVGLGKEGLNYYDRGELELLSGILGGGAGFANRRSLAQLAQGSAAPRAPSMPGALPGQPAAPTTGSMEAPTRPGPVRPPLGGTGTQNYGRAFGLGDIEAGRAVDMTKQPGGVHDLTTQRRMGLQRVNELFPNQFREDPRFGGLMTPEERPGAGPRGPTGQIGGGKPPPIVKPPGALDRVTKVFTDMASRYPGAARGVSVAASKFPLVTYPAAGASIGRDVASAAYELGTPNPDYLEAGLSGLQALGTGLSLYPPTAPIGIPMALTPSMVRYFKENKPEEDPSLGLQMP